MSGLVYNSHGQCFYRSVDKRKTDKLEKRRFSLSMLAISCVLFSVAQQAESGQFAPGSSSVTSLISSLPNPIF